MRALLKWLGIIPLLLLYIFCALVLWAFPAGPRLRRVLLMKNTSFFSGLVLDLLGVRIRLEHPEHLPKKARNILIVANHVSYIDVLVIVSLMPSVFITSVELGRTAVLGLLARLGGSLFVERRKATGLKKEIAEISRVLAEGNPVVLFPEGTTSNGERVHPFRNALFDAAIAAKADILPLCIRYTRLNGEEVTPENRDKVFYYGGTTFFRHFPRLLSVRSVEVDVLPQKIIRNHETVPRKELAARVHDTICKAYRG